MTFLNQHKYFFQQKLGSEMKGLSSADKQDKYVSQYKRDTRKFIAEYYSKIISDDEKIKFYDDLYSQLSTYENEYITQNLLFEKQSIIEKVIISFDTVGENDYKQIANYINSSKLFYQFIQELFLEFGLNINVKSDNNEKINIFIKWLCSTYHNDSLPQKTAMLYFFHIYQINSVKNNIVFLFKISDFLESSQNSILNKSIIELKHDLLNEYFVDFFHPLNKSSYLLLNNEVLTGLINQNQRLTKILDNYTFLHQNYLNVSFEDIISMINSMEDKTEFFITKIIEKLNHFQYPEDCNSLLDNLSNERIKEQLSYHLYLL